MNHIIEINEKNMYAIVEPFVVGAQLQAELMRHGLTCNMNGTGSHVAAMHFASGLGHGFTSQTHGFADRNVLGVEWVSPEGEVVRFGSAGSNNDWFCGDGPGPSLRSLTRSRMGIFTRAAIKVYHWPGPPTMPISGISPNYTPAEVPENFLLRFYTFKTTDQMVEATRRLSEAEIPLQLSHSLTMLSSAIATSNAEDLELLNRCRKEALGPGFVITIAGISAEELAYKKAVLEIIMQETGGVSMKSIEDPKVWSAVFWHFIRTTTAIREAIRAGGFWFGNMAGYNYSAIKAKYSQTAGRLKDQMVKDGLVFEGDQGVIDLMLWPQENGHRGLAEIVFRFHPTPETYAGIENLKQQCFKIMFEEHQPGSYAPPRGIPAEKIGLAYSNYPYWSTLLKKAIDPNNIQAGGIL
jgi:glycolate oxidase